jgi:NAD-dependent dihydropyrimidine dehydrogenase PreA subunit
VVFWRRRRNGKKECGECVTLCPQQKARSKAVLLNKRGEAAKARSKAMLLNERGEAAVKSSNKSNAFV